MSKPVIWAQGTSANIFYDNPHVHNENGICLKNRYEPRCDNNDSTTGNTPSTDANPLVDHPKHYNLHPAGIECIDVIEHMSFNIGTAIKHMWRAGLKPNNDDVQDLEKAAWYLAREIENRKGNRSKVQNNLVG